MKPRARLFTILICVALMLGVSLQLQRLPVDLVDFEATAEGENTVELRWQTATETNNEGFEVQRQLSEDDWEALGFVDGAGTTSETMSYLYTADDVPAGSQQFRLKQVDVDGDSTFSDTASVDVLPVELAFFEAVTTESGVRLTWQTASETNNSGFDVQRRAEGSSWTTVDFVEGSGTTSEPQSYRFTDTDLPYDADRLTYRLRQVDTDGTATLTDPVTIERRVDTAELLGTFPNPASEQATVRYALPAQQDAQIRLYDALGRQVRTVVNARKEGRHEETIDVSELSSGTYFLRLQAESATKSQQVTVVR